ncbi:uncharacterized protein LOC142987474 isoform X2 [Anticarsia gemmatalis]|uniref:uncharacterized protein LOC142987474 isoform X2 n=1 Tax=Anticarsia gemmatalis TaxID=129554 RepID=UPI003F75EFED
MTSNKIPLVISLVPATPQINQVKKRITRANILINSYNLQKHVLDETIKNLDAANQERLKASKDYKEALETCSRLENALQELTVVNRTNDTAKSKAINQYEALQSHTAQLEQLTKEQQKKIEYLESTNKDAERMIARLEKSKNGESKTSAADKKNEVLEKQVSELINDKKKLKAKYKELLWRFKKLKNDDSFNADDDSDSNDNGSLLQHHKEDILQTELQNGSCSSSNKYIQCPESDNDCMNEVDTGRGSSLASSDADTCLQSPEYYLSPIKAETIRSKWNSKLVETATSPIPFTQEINDKSSSPASDSVVTTDRSVSPIIFNTMKSVSTSPITTMMVDIGTSPIKRLVKQSNKRTQTRINIEKAENERDSGGDKGVNLHNVPHIRVQRTPEEECLEINSSKHYSEDCDTNDEVEKILVAMKLNAKPVSPMPITPPTPRPNRIHDIQAGNICRPLFADIMTAKKQTITLDEQVLVAREQAAVAREQAAASREQAVASREQVIAIREQRVREREQELAVKEETAITRAEAAVAAINAVVNLQEDFYNLDKNILSMDDMVLNQNKDCNLVNDIDINIRPSHDKQFNSDNMDVSTSPQVNNESHANVDLQVVEISQPLPVTPANRIRILSDQIFTAKDIEELRSKRRQAVPAKQTEPSLSIGQDDEENVISPELENVEIIKGKNESPNRRVKKSTKLTNLVKYRKRCETQLCKIKKESPRRKHRLKPKPLLLEKKFVKLFGDTSASLNDKDVYEKAVKVMAELNASKSGDKNVISSANTTAGSNIECTHETNNDRNIDSSMECNENIAGESIVMETSEKQHLTTSETQLTPHMETSIGEESVSSAVESEEIIPEPIAVDTSMNSTDQNVMDITDENITSQKEEFDLEVDCVSNIECHTMSSTLMEPVYVSIPSPKPITSLAPSSEVTCSMTSPELPDTPLIAIYTSPPGSSESPELPLTSPEPVIESPDPVVESPTPDGASSPVITIKSKENVITYSKRSMKPSPVIGVSESQKHLMTSPISENLTVNQKSKPAGSQAFESTKHLITSPINAASSEPSITCDVNTGSSKASMTSPVNTASSKLSMTSPVSTASSKSLMKYPVNTASSKPSITSPVNTAPSETKITSPVNTPSSGSSLNSPVNTASSKPSITSPVNTAPSETKITSPVDTPSSGTSLTSPVNTAILNPSITSPVNTAQSESSITPPVNTPSLKSSITSPVNTVLLKPSVSSPVNTDPSETKIISPLNTVSSEPLLTSPVNTALLKPSITSPVNTAPSETTVTSPVNTPSSGTSLTSPVNNTLLKPLITSPVNTAPSETKITSPVNTPSSGTSLTSPVNTALLKSSTTFPLNTASPKSSITSPVNIAPSQSLITSPVNTTSLTPSRISPISAASSKASITSPLNTISLNPSMISPINTASSKSSMTSPVNTFSQKSSMTALVNSALLKTSMTSPVNIASLKSSVNTASVKPSITSPINTTSSETPIRSPVNITSLKTSITSPVNTASSKQSIPSPVNTAPSKSSIKSPVNTVPLRPSITSPINTALKSPITSPVYIASSQSFTSPLYISTSQTSLTSPVYIPTTKSSITSPNIDRSSLRPWITSPKRFSTSPMINLVSPKPRRYITSPDVPVGYVNPPITSPISPDPNKGLASTSLPSAVDKELTIASPTSVLKGPVVTSKPPAANMESAMSSNIPPIANKEPAVCTLTTSATNKPTVTCNKLAVNIHRLPEQCSVVLNKDPKLAQFALHSINADKQNRQMIKDTNKIEEQSRKRKLFATDTGIDCKRVMHCAQQLSAEEFLDVNSETIAKEMSTPIIAKNKEKDKDKEESSCPIKDSILCRMIENYGVVTVKPFYRIVPDAISRPICEKIEAEVSKINEMASGKEQAMEKFVMDLQKYNYKHFVIGLMKYLTKPDRKLELFSKTSALLAPAMTKSEEVLLYVIRRLRTYWQPVDIVNLILTDIEYVLFQLNRTPEFDVIESASHFFALVCRYFKKLKRLRMFMLDAMYCIQFKAVPLVKQCLEVWRNVIPLAHMSKARTPIVTCLVYLLHFYKCDDRYNRVQDIRNILHRKYHYEIMEWNERKMLDMFRNAIKELKDIPLQRKMLRLALIILAKRHGPRWTQKNIIKNLIQPLIEKETTPLVVREFCLSAIGCLMKPYPIDMKVHCEIAINQLMDILKTSTCQRIDEAVISSLVMLSRHNHLRINEMLAGRKMQKMSTEVEQLIRDYIRTKPIKMWKDILPKIPVLSVEI